MAHPNPIRLTSAEIAQLWSAYVNDSLALCLLKYFSKTVQDKETAGIVDSTLQLVTDHVRQLEQFLKNDRIPVPHGFKESDVNLHAPKLFSDPLILQYIKNMGSLGMSAYSLATTITARADVRQYFSDCLRAATDYHNKATDLLLLKGLYVRPPYVPVPEEVEFVHKESFLNGFFGDRRPLNTVEIGQLFFNSITNCLGEALMIAYSQTARDPEIKSFILRGRDMAHKHFETFNATLQDDRLPTPATWDASITDSTVAPFSDKLMLVHTTFLIAIGIANYGMSISLCSRRDVGALYTRLMAECAAYAADGAKLIIERGWMEKIPEAVDRDALAMK